MTKKVIDDSNLGHLVSKAKAAFWPKEDVINVNLADVATSGDYNDLSNKPTIPDVSNFITKSVNDLTNYYLKSETYTKEEVAALIGAIQQFHYEISASTSAVTSPANNVLYLIGPTGSGSDKYEEYVYDETKPVAERWIKIGDTTIDLSGYVTIQALNTALAGKQDSLVSGTNIKTLNGDSLLGSGNLTSAYIVEVSLTLNSETNKYSASIVSGSIAEINAALSSNKTVIAKCVSSGGTVYYLRVVSNDTSEIMFGGDYQYFGVPISCSLVWAESSEGEHVYFEHILQFSGIQVSGNGNAITELTPNEIGGYQVAATATKGSTFVDTAEQTLTEEQKTQARTNIGAGSYSKPSGGIPASDIASGVIPAAPVNADWNATSGLAEILNKPTVPTTYAGSPTAGGFANKTVAIPFGSVDSTSTATEITATVDNFPETLTDGVCAYIRNNVISSASGWTLNINGTGEKPVYNTIADATRVSSVFNANSTYLFVYNSSRVEGGCWDIYYGYNANDNTVGYMLRTNGASTPPAAQKYYRYRLLFTAANGLSLVPANTSSSTSATAAKTVNQTKIDPFGVIFYYSYSSAVNASASPSAAYLWMQYNGITLGYSFNRTGEALEMTARDPVYLKCAPQSDGSAIIDADNPIVQALPTTADGKIYIFLGFAESATNITLYYWHPVYYHDGTRIVIWSGKQDTLTFDTIPTENSTNPVTSGGIYNAITENEQVTAAALNDLRDKSLELENDISTIDKVTASSLNDLNDRTKILEETALTSQRIFIGDATTEIDRSGGDEEWQDYINHCDPDPQEGDILIPYNTKVGFIANSKEAIVFDNFDNYSEQGWPSASANFIRYSFNVNPDFWGTLELVTSTPGTYKVYSYVENWSHYTDATEITIGSEDITSDGLYRKKFEGSVDNNSNLYIYYTDNEPNVDVYRYLPDSEPLEFYSPGGGWIIRQNIAKKASEHLDQSTNMNDEVNYYPSNHTVLNALKKYPKVSSSIENYDSVKDKYICFSWIEYISQQNNSQGVSIYLRCSTSSTTPKTVQVSSSDYSGWTDKTPDTLDENGCYYVLLGTLTTSNHNLYVKGNNTSYGDSSNYCYFDISGPCYLYGDMISLVGGHTGGSDNNDISDEVYAQSYTFPHMFKNQTNIFSHPTCRLYMITKRISSSGYHYTFEGCENMIISPIISGSPKGSYALNGIFHCCYNMKASLCNVSALIDSTWYPWLPSGVCQTDGHVIYNPGGSYYSNYDISVETNDTYYGLFTDIINSENTILFNKVSSLVSNNSSLLSNSILPNKIYEFGTLTSSQVFSLSTIKRPGISHYFWTFETGATAPTITWPSGLTWPGGSPPAILPNKHYEISVLNNIVAWMEV